LKIGPPNFGRGRCGLEQHCVPDRCDSVPRFEEREGEAARMALLWRWGQRARWRQPVAWPDARDPLEAFAER
jgi:hypothetical protein